MTCWQMIKAIHSAHQSCWAEFPQHWFHAMKSTRRGEEHGLCVLLLESESQFSPYKLCDPRTFTYPL